MSRLNEEIAKRRTFAIISHPDAGKTTLTEKLLLFGGQLLTAGAVKSNKIQKSTTSDFMEIERQRGISVSTSVMSFEYRDLKINILDTPGHQDFSEDTYRTLTAVDSVILVVDSVKGVESQTERLMNVCRMRKTPVIIFINKLDREGQSPFELMDEIETKLNIKVRPLTWPISRGKSFKGVYNLHKQNLNLFEANSERIAKNIVEIKDINQPELDEYIGDFAEKLREDVALIEGVYDPFDKEAYLSSDVAPVFFGSAVNSFGVNELLDTFCDIAPEPMFRMTDKRKVMPDENLFTGFVFKIHANLDPRHRNRMVFVRICSGIFEQKKYYHHVRLNKNLKFNTPASFVGQKKETIEEAYPGDVVGLYDVGNFKIGDTLTEGEVMNFQGIPSFSPEIFKLLNNRSFEKVKQLEKGVLQLSEEGVAQLFIQDQGRRKIIGTVGQLQFEVLQYRLLNEYGADCDFSQLKFTRARWITSKNPAKITEFCKYQNNQIAKDKDGNLVFFAESDWMLQFYMKDHPDIEFHTTSEFKTRQI
ncbi:MAG TPA: peptide chain release factor 3 [bacterium]|nr:peptide chain release factor 3 [bacterium]